MQTSRNVMSNFIFLAILLTVTTLANASSLGTSTTIITKEPSASVAIVGTVSPNLYKPVGVTGQTIHYSRTNYAKSAMCAAEFSSSRICTTEEMIYFPNRVNVGAAGASLMCEKNTEMSGLTCSTNGSTNIMLFINNDISNTLTKQIEKYPNIPVICCAP